MRTPLAEARRIVVKVGSSLVTAGGVGLDRGRIDRWAAQIDGLLGAGRQIVLVSSGAVAEGRARLGLTRRPRELAALQAAAAVGQMGLVRAYEEAFAAHGRRTAQVLLTHDDLRDRARYLNARQTLRQLLSWQVVPVVNENDTVATDEIRLGDNDTLAALVANLVDAELLVILTDQQGLFSADPRQDPGARLIAEAGVADPSLDEMAGAGRGELGRGGMRTKLLAARWAARSGTHTVIADGRTPDALARIAAGEALGTWLKADIDVLAARKRWLAGPQRPAGRLHLDDGAARAVASGRASLLAVGMTAAEGQFRRGDLVSLLDPQGREIARGLVNHDDATARALCGLDSEQVTARLGPGIDAEVVHRDNLVLTALRPNEKADPVGSA